MKKEVSSPEYLPSPVRLTPMGKAVVALSLATAAVLSGANFDSIREGIGSAVTTVTNTFDGQEHCQVGGAIEQEPGETDWHMAVRVLPHVRTDKALLEIESVNPNFNPGEPHGGLNFPVNCA